MTSNGLVALSIGLALAAPAAAGDFVLVGQDLRTQPITLVELNADALVHVDEDGWRKVELKACIAVFDPAARTAGPAIEGVLELADGQRLPGQAVPEARPSDQSLAWNHAWLGRIDVPIDLIRSVRFFADAPLVTPGDADVVVLTNGDRQEGFVVALGDPLRLEVSGESGPRVIEIPLERAAAVAMVAPQRRPAGRRVWFTDGSVVDVASIQIGDDGFVRLGAQRAQGAQQSPGAPVAQGADDPSSRLRLEQIAAILFDPDAMVPLAALSPSRIEGPPTRFAVPAPRVLDADAPLGLSRISCRGPVTIRYALPEGATRFAATARLPESARRWGDFELTVLDDDRPVHRSRLNGQSPTVSINVALSGSELTIALGEGKYGSIQDLLELDHAMILVK